MKIEIKDNKLGPVLIVVKAELLSNKLVLQIDHSHTFLKEIIDDDTNNMTSNSFLYIVKEFIKNNDFSFEVGKNFKSRVWGEYWYFDIEGKELTEMEVFINNLNN